MNRKNMTIISMMYLFGTLFNRGISFLTVPIFTRLLSTEDYGLVTTYVSWVSIIGMIIGFTLHMGIRAAFIDYSEEIEDVTSTVLTFTLLVFLGISALTCGGIVLLQINVSLSLVFMCLVQSFFSAVITDYSMYLMMKYRYRLRTVLMIFPNLVSAILSILAILFVFRTDPYLGRIVSYFVSYAVFGLLALGLCFKASRPRIKKEYLFYTLKISAPLIIHGISLIILSQSDRTMITMLADASQTGIYSLVYNFSMIGIVISTALEGVWIPWFTERMKTQDYQKINERAREYINLMTYLMIGLILVAPEILKVMAPVSYWEGITIIPPIVLANYIIFLDTMHVNVEHFYKKTVYISVNTAIAAGINILMNLVLIPVYGYVAAAYTTLASYLISLILHMQFTKKAVPVLYPVKMIAKPLAYIGVSVIVFYALMNIALARWFIALVFVLVMFYKDRKQIIVFLPDRITVWGKKRFHQHENHE